MRKDQVTWTCLKEEASYYMDLSQGGRIMLLTLVTSYLDWSQGGGIMLLRLVSRRKGQDILTGNKEEESSYLDWSQGGRIMLLGLISRRKDQVT